MRFLIIPLLCSLAVFGQTDPCYTLDRHGKKQEAAACYQGLVRSKDAFNRAQGYFGLRQYQQANDEFRQAEKEHPGSAIIKTAWATLFLALDKQDASDLFREAIKADPTYAPAYVGLARKLAAEDADKGPNELLNQALKEDPKYFPAHELSSYLALEAGHEDAAKEEAQKALAISSGALDAMAVLAAIDFLKGDGTRLADNSPWMDRLLKINPYYGEAYATAAHFFEMNYRYTEAIAAYRKALELDPALVQARSQLGVNLMRVGQTDEAQKQLSQCYREHFQNAETRNSLKFLDTVGQYEHFTTKTTEIVINKSEAALLRPYVETQLHMAMAAYERKYKITLPGPVRLEVYPNHEDFVVRTLGLPGQGGLLGVTFGTVVAIDSPTAREPGEFSWADTIWHELCHVYVISATHHLVPRWFSEGLAVHEEGVASPYWGNRLAPETIAAVKQKKLLPVLELDSGFVRPQYPNQVIVSYYQAGQICDFIAQKWGDTAILGMIHSFAAHKSTQEALQDNLHVSADAFDKEFMAWINQRSANVVAHFDQWKEGMKAASADLKSNNASAAVQKLSEIRGFFPEYSATYELLGRAYQKLANKPDETLAWEQYQAAGGTAVDTLKRLAKLQADDNHQDKAIATLNELNLIYPEDLEIHQRLGSLLLARSQNTQAVQEYRAELALKPTDLASAHLDLARALAAAHQTSEAKDQVLMSLEAAPNFKPAQQLLLQLSQ